MSAEKIGDIKEQLKSITDSQLTQFIEAYGSDERGGVIKLVDSAKKRLDKYEKELIRTEGLKKYEREYASYAHICGIDEVGRGPLAGPVVACAVILPKDCDILYINDSKKLTAAKRDELYDVTDDLRRAEPRRRKAAAGAAGAGRSFTGCGAGAAGSSTAGGSAGFSSVITRVGSSTTGAAVFPSVMMRVGSSATGSIGAAGFAAGAARGSGALSSSGT